MSGFGESGIGQLLEGLCSWLTASTELSVALLLLLAVRSEKCVTKVYSREVKPTGKRKKH